MALFLFSGFVAGVYSNSTGEYRRLTERDAKNAGISDVYAYATTQGFFIDCDYLPPGVVRPDPVKDSSQGSKRPATRSRDGKATSKPASEKPAAPKRSKVQVADTPKAARGSNRRKK
jgi:hypothetical protein